MLLSEPDNDGTLGAWQRQPDRDETHMRLWSQGRLQYALVDMMVVVKTDTVERAMITTVR